MAKGQRFQGIHEVTHEFERIGRCTMLLSARGISGDAGQTKLILLAIEEITRRRPARPPGVPDKEALPRKEWQHDSAI